MALLRESSSLMKTITRSLATYAESRSCSISPSESAESVRCADAGRARVRSTRANGSRGVIDYRLLVPCVGSLVFHDFSEQLIMNLVELFQGGVECIAIFGRGFVHILSKPVGCVFHQHFGILQPLG